MASNAANRKKVVASASRKATTRKAQKVLPVAKAKAGKSGKDLGYNTRPDNTSRVGTNDPKYMFAEKGVRPHVIRPKNGRTLVFPGIDGKKTHATVVYHPGSRGTHALRDSLRG